MWTYVQDSGKLYKSDGELVATGYSGHGDGKNNPAKQEVHDVGPVPVGAYLIGTPKDSPKHGPFAMPLIPFKSNQMFGRSAFMIHGDSRQHPGEASNGCIIMPRPVREQVWASPDHALSVVATTP